MWSNLTVNPLDRVVVSVLTPFFTTGVANPLLNGATALRPARPRSPWLRFKANRRDAMWVVRVRDVFGVSLGIEGRDIGLQLRDWMVHQICRS
jgi:hypothetical protein